MITITAEKVSGDLETAILYCTYAAQYYSHCPFCINGQIQEYRYFNSDFPQHLREKLMRILRKL